jgi:hypothetical protein
MDVYGSGTPSVRKEITCGDCGHVYLIAQGQPSARCLNCGNIEFFPQTEGKKLGALSKEIVAKRVIPRLEEKAAPEDPLVVFRSTPDGGEVEDLRIRYQVEWQLWAMLVKNFQSPAYHMAYLCQATATNELERAAERYRAHLSVMALLPESHWQSEVAELMLSRIETLSLVRMTAEGRGWWAQLPSRFYLMRTDSRAMRVAWLAIGLAIFVKVFSLTWWR